jgi:UDP-glucose-4-epimerase GalE
MAKHLARNGYTPIVLDNLVCGHKEAVKFGPFFEGSMSDRDLLSRIFEEHTIAAVMHFAAFCYVGESMTEPAKYYENNIVNTLVLLEGMLEKQIDKFIFSSSCSIYGEPIEVPIKEDHPKNPINPYGRTKLVVEQMLADFQQAYELNSISLRYFNAAGADPDGELGEDHDPETHLIPLVLQTALGQRSQVDIFGNDYPTPDGTCVRDYIHIEDLAQAHMLALERLLSGSPGDVYNLGNAEGHSVRQVIETVQRISGREIPTEVVGKRPGDPAVLVSASEKAIRELGWKPRFPELETIIETAWAWHKAHPRGYL